MCIRNQANGRSFLLIKLRLNFLNRLTIGLPRAGRNELHLRGIPSGLNCRLPGRRGILEVAIIARNCGKNFSAKSKPRGDVLPGRESQLINRGYVLWLHHGHDDLGLVHMNRKNFQAHGHGLRNGL